MDARARRTIFLVAGFLRSLAVQKLGIQSITLVFLAALFILQARMVKASKHI